MPDHTPEPKPAANPQSIREYLDASPVKAGHGAILANCAKHGISLDSPWPPHFPDEPESPEQRPAPPPAPVRFLQFPQLFGEDTRAVSNLLARCPLFAPVKERDHFKHYVTLYDSDGIKLEWKGEQLNQDDHDTFLQLVRMAMDQPFGGDVVQPVNAVLRGMGRHTRQEQRRQLFEQVDRIKTGTLRITPAGRPSYTGNLIIDLITPQEQKDEPQHRRYFSYQLNPRLASLYSNNALTLVDWRERLKITGRGSELAKWLHLWITSHAEQFAHKVETIREKCGSKIQDLSDFRCRLRAALNLLKEAGVINSWHIDQKDLVHIDRTPSAAQLEYLAKKAAKETKRRRRKMTAAADLVPRLPKPEK
jgi:hypothetical protein